MDTKNSFVFCTTYSTILFNPAISQTISIFYMFATRPIRVLLAYINNRIPPNRLTRFATKIVLGFRSCQTKFCFISFLAADCTLNIGSIKLSLALTITRTVLSPSSFKQIWLGVKTFIANLALNLGHRLSIACVPRMAIYWFLKLSTNSCAAITP